MAPSSSPLSERAYVLLCGDTDFDRLVARVLERVRRFMAVPDDVDDLDVQEEFAALRAHLDGYLPAYRQAYVVLIGQHLDEGGRLRLIRQLEQGREPHESMRLRALQQAVHAELGRLEKRMGEIPLYGPVS